MYKIYADDTLIYDSTLEDYKIGKGQISLEVNKSGSCTFSVYPDHFFYDSFIKLKTVITVFKDKKIVFRGRILNDVTDYWNNKVLTCEGELGFLQDSIIRPFSFNGTPEALFKKIINEHNAQVDEFKRFKIGTVTVTDPNNYIARSNTAYETALSNLNSRLIEDSLGGYFYITHGENGDDLSPTINYLADFTEVASQTVEFGANLKDYTKTVTANDIGTAIIPLGKEVDDGNSESEDPKLNIKSVNNNVDYVYSPEGVALYGWIFKVVEWLDVTVASILKSKAEAYLKNLVEQNITIELNAIDLHLLDKSIESFKLGDYIHVISKPHNFDSTLLCSKQTLDIINPANDTVTLGYNSSSFTDNSAKVSASISNIKNETTKLSGTVSSIKQTSDSINLTVEDQKNKMSSLEVTLDSIEGTVSDMDEGLSQTLRIASDGVTITNAQGSTLTIDGGQINAETLNLSGRITFNDLDSSVQDDINSSYDKAEEASDTVSGWTYSGTTYIDGAMIKSGTVMASHLIGGDISLYDSDEDEAGYISLDSASTARYALDIHSNGALRLIADEGAVYIADETDTYIQISGRTVSVGVGDLCPGDDDELACGLPGLRWSDIYSTNATIQTSDKTKKENIEYGLNRYEALFDSLKPVSFTFKKNTSGRRHMGLIAQDVEKAMTKNNISSEDFAVFIKSPKKDSDNNVIEGEYDYALRYGELIALCIEQIQTLKKRVAELEGKL